MKRHITLIVAILVLAISCNSGKKSIPDFSGKIKNCTASFGIVNIGNTMDTIPIDSDGTFSYNLKKGQYGVAGFVIKGVHYYGSFYLEHGHPCRFEIDANNVDDLFITGATETSSAFIEDALANIRNWKPAEDCCFVEYRSSRREYFKTIVAESQKVGGRKFSKAMDELLSSMLLRDCIGYVNQLSKRGLPPDSDAEYSDFMNSINLDSDSNISNVFTVASWKAKVEFGCDRNDYLAMLNIIRRDVNNQTVLDEYSLRLARMYFTSDDTSLADSVLNVAVSMASLEVKEKIEAFYNATMKSEGKSSPVFNVCAPDGTTVSWASLLKKKVVYVDMWSTWCVPCCKEIPYVAQLAEHYQNNPDVAIISLSIDKNLDSWRKYLKEHNYSVRWPQYVVPEEEQARVLREFGVNGIPRFMVFDEKGRIRDANAPRPSVDSIFAYLDKFLK